MQIPFATQSYKHNSSPLSAQRVVNFYAEQEPPDAKSSVALIGSPGISLFATIGTAPIRGMHVMNDILYVVSGAGLYKVTAAGVASNLGTGISGASEMVSMANNGTQICIVNGTNGYIYSAATGLVAISSPDFHSAHTVTFFDNYFVFDWASTNKFFVSNLLDGTTFSALDFASAEVNPDYVVAIVNQQENLLIFNEHTIETWYDAGNVNFPFQRYDGATIERGCAASLTPVKEDNSVFFLGDDMIFYRLNGIIPVRVSTHAIEQIWRTYTSVSDAFCYSFTQNGHKMIVLTFTTGNSTWIYDIATNLWHERESWDVNSQSLVRWYGNAVINCYGLNLVGDFTTGRVGQLVDTVYSEYGNTMRGLLISPPIHSNRKRVFHSSFELDMEVGVGLSSGQGSDPQIMLDYSDDGGRTYSNPQRWSSVGAQGQYTQRVRWTRLGQARQRVYRVSISDPVKRTIIGAYAETSIGL